MKAGRTRAGSRAAGSHTAALAASDTAVDALFQQSGVIRADTIDEMFDIAALPRLRSRCRRTPRRDRHQRGRARDSRGRRLRSRRLTVSPFGARHARGSPRFCRPRPASATRWTWWRRPGPRNTAAPIEVALTADDIDALIVIFTPVDPTRSSETLDAIRDGHRRRTRAPAAPTKPILALRDGADRAGRSRSIIGGERVPAYAFPENAARALGQGRDVRGMARADARSVLELRRHPRRRRADVCRAAIARATATTG